MADTMGEVHDAITGLHRAIEGARDKLLCDSTNIRHTQERALEPIREWVHDVDQMLAKHAKNNVECRNFQDRLREIEGAYLGDCAIELEYNIETAMDKCTSDALDGVTDALSRLEEAMADQPLLGNDDTAVAIREIAEVLCE